MAGVKGRSGGHNRKSYWQHKLTGTLQPCRHKPVPATASAASRLADAQHAYSFTASLVVLLREQLTGFASKQGPAPPGASTSIQELRQHTLLLLQVGAAVGRLERELLEAPKDEANPFDEFEKFDRRAGGRAS